MRRGPKRAGEDPTHRAIVLVRTTETAEIAEWLRNLATTLEEKPELVSDSIGGFYVGSLE